MDYCIGVDQSVNHTGFCVLSSKGKIQQLDLIEPSPKWEDARKFVFLRDTLYSYVRACEGNIVAVAMEDYSYGSINRKFDLGAVGGIVKMLSVDFDIKRYEIAPKQRAKFATGKGSANKEEVKASVYKKFGTKIDDDNLADAYVLAIIANRLSFGGSKVRHELEVLKKINDSVLPKPSKRAKTKLPVSI